MGKFNNNNKKGKKNNNGYFARNIQQNGKDFLNRKTPKDIQYDFRNIIRDIAFSGPDQIPDYVEFFTSVTFLNNLSLVANQEFAKENATFLGLQSYLAYAASSGIQIDPALRLQENMMLSQSRAAAYSIVSFNLNYILNLFSVVPEQGVDYDMMLRNNIQNVLLAINAQLKQYKRIL